MDQAQREAIARAFVAALPFSRALGLALVSIGDGVAELEMPWDARLVGDPETGVIHGGAVFALVDTCAGTAVMSHPAAPRRTATLDLRIDYMRPAIPGRAIRASAQCHHVARSVAFVRVTASDGDPRPLATAVAAFAVEGLGEGPGDVPSEGSMP